MHIILAGNPNCGKTTLFNALTGDNQRVGNWPGVTVEKKTGNFSLQDKKLQVTDLPGIYSLSTDADNPSLDEKIAAQALLEIDADCIVNIVNACHLERNLYLTSQLLEFGKPLILVLNMMDLAQKQGIQIDKEALSRQLGCPVVTLQAHTGLGLDQLEKNLATPPQAAGSLNFFLDEQTQQSFDFLKAGLLQEGKSPILAHYLTWRSLESGQASHNSDIDMILADARYQKLHDIVSEVQKKQSDASEQITAKIDKIVLHRFLAFPIFFAMMYLMFLFAINIGGAFQDFFDISTDTIFVQGAAWCLQQAQAPGWLIALIANGIGKGINTTLAFIPVIAAMFFFLSLLEASGYMARAAFVVDKAMRAMGLPGKAFVPMIVGFGCNVPAIMAARTLDSERDRLLTVLMSPFMSCSARLAIYAVFVAAFFPHGGQNIVFSLYLIGILMAVLTGFLLRKTLFKGDASPLILELPVYHKPALSRLFRETGLRLKYFVWRAGKLILPVCVLLGALNALTLSGDVSAGEANSQSLLSWFGQLLTPLFAPMGLHQDNWPATVGLLTGMLAKEVVVGSLNALYAQIGQVQEAAAGSFSLLGGLQEALWSIPHNLAQLGSAFANPILASAPDSPLSQSVYGIMAQRFDGQAGAYAYLLFILLYIPCVSTMAVIRQEANRQLMWLSILWSFIIAYAAAVLFYQSARFTLHPQESMAWILGILVLLLLSAKILIHYGHKKETGHVISIA